MRRTSSSFASGGQECREGKRTRMKKPPAGKGRGSEAAVASWNQGVDDSAVRSAYGIGYCASAFTDRVHGVCTDMQYCCPDSANFRAVDFLQSNRG
ncbi:hypothetical protein [Oryza sativa Japonica Group]|uniref:Uncharacterized protein n=2 Tax=Oryza sativa subsp. japonica TaxID=39947 RepID=Q5NAP9_ORYSJ|nr:hypothetical protein [Oryza sativa Japonica Group]BAD81541.1 hypothetical protein [Oryza sativa Japonica Group]BAS71104.1 Os01g0224601 [Oryza sativa Japonica Group]